MINFNELGFGRFECLGIEHGTVVLDPWPPTVRSVKFGWEDPTTQKRLRHDFESVSSIALLGSRALQRCPSGMPGFQPGPSAGKRKAAGVFRSPPESGVRVD